MQSFPQALPICSDGRFCPLLPDNQLSLTYSKARLRGKQWEPPVGKKGSKQTSNLLSPEEEEKGRLRAPLETPCKIANK